MAVAGACPSSYEPRSPLRHQGAVLIGLLALFVGIDHAWWATETTAPLVRGDAPRHALTALTLAHDDGSFLGWATFLRPAYYPNLVPWLARPLLQLEGATGADYRVFLALFSGLFTLGTGLLARRCWGTGPGLAAAALTLTVPLLWTLRAETMLDLPLAAMTALFLASVPMVPGRPVRAAGSGLLLGLGMLTKQTLPYLAVPALGWLWLWALRPLSWGGRCLGALSGVAVAGGAGALFMSGWGWTAVGVALLGLGAIAAVAQRVEVLGLRDLALLGLVAVVVAGPWFALSVEPILQGLVVTRADHADVPATLSAAGALRIASMGPYVVLQLLPAWMVWGLLAGVLAQVARRPRPALLGPVVLALLGGGLAISAFPDLHARHYAPLVAPLLVLTVAPLAWLPGRLRSVGSGVITVIALAAGLSWHVGGDTAAGYRAAWSDRQISRDVVARDWVDLARRWAVLPANPHLLAMPPLAGDLPLAAAVATIEQDRSASGPLQGMLVPASPAVEQDGLLLAIEEARLDTLFAVERFDRGLLQERPPEVGVIYAVEVVSEGSRRGGLRPSRELDQLGFTTLGAWPARLPEWGSQLELRVRRWAPEP